MQDGYLIWSLTAGLWGERSRKCKHASCEWALVKEWMPVVVAAVHAFCTGRTKWAMHANETNVHVVQSVWQHDVSAKCIGLSSASPWHHIGLGAEPLGL